MNILKKQIPLRYLYLIGVLVLILISLGLYVTYAMFTADINDDKVLSIESNVTYDFGINGTQSFNVGAHTNVLFNANIINNSENEVYYEIYYTSNDNLTDTIIAELVEDTSSTTSAPNTSGNLTNGSNKTVYIGLINTGDTSVNVTIGVVNISVGDTITYGSNNYPSGYKITTVYNVSEVSDGCNAKDCITRIENGEEKTYCPVSDYSDIIVKSNIGNFKRGLYNVSSNCSNATSSFNTKNWEFRIKDLTNYSECTATFTEDTTTYPTLYDHIIALWNNTNGSNNIYKEDHTINGNSYSEYRYEGTNTEVNNYVWFNNELWRIIGAFPGGTPTTDADNLGDGAPSVNNTVKIIRDDAIGSFAWHKSNTSDWTKASLNTEILNNLYLNSLSGTCYFYKTRVGKSCSFINNGLANVQDYIETATWNLGGYNREDVSASDMYTYERGTSVYSGRPVVTTAKVGLMYLSDYGYSVTNANCSHTSTNLDSYNTAACGGKAWLLKYGYEWTSTPDFFASSGVFYVDSHAYVHSADAGNGYGVRPVLYLKSNIYVTNGNDANVGTRTNPYKIAIK